MSEHSPEDGPDPTADNETPEEQTAAHGRDYTQRSVVRVCSILNMLQREVDGVSLNQIVEATGLAKPSAFRYMWTLERQRYVERDGKGGAYRLGLGFAGLQSRRLEVLRERARPWLVTMSQELGETANLGLLDNHAVLYVNVVESPSAVRLSATPGHQAPLHTTALGKAIAAELPEARVRELLEQAGMEKVTKNAITSVDDYLSELDRVRKVGYAIDNGENDIDGRCVAAPLAGTRMPAAISISAPAFRLTKRQLAVVGKRLIEIASEITPHPDEIQLDSDAVGSEED
ncbi:IclR family transcriptional regulator [Phytoactinopolyspora mesophila]|uniref:Helix-turn-helix domain-containing protein n=1 Tax=Phytoactinopolyspora mesophila TaxID=2650750 RepID=A0A7K3M067_9ACTN|nr:IclR family transcriptional regulator [Phytoactinopolyspora mesophila]NDL56640.1 helix-turn-helix domain-containing protein [Phytoactinopolyspora mesophila]